MGFWQNADAGRTQTAGDWSVTGTIPLFWQSRAARQLMERIQSHSMEARLDAMKELAKLSADVTFATEFINMEGITVLTRLVESGTKLLSQ